MVNRLLVLFSIVLLITLLFNCDGYNLGSDIEDPNPPKAPNFIPQSAPSDSLQEGIGPAEYIKGINLEWYNNKEDDIGGYYIYRAEKSADSTFQVLDTIEIITNITESNSYTDTLINYYTNYYYYLTAYDYGRNESNPSDTIRYMLTEGVDLVDPDGTIQDEVNTFTWYDFTTLTNEYVIELQALQNTKTIWITRFNRPDYGDSEQTVRFNFDGSAFLDNLEKDKLYRWRVHSISIVDQNNRDICGAKSNWNYFNIE